MYCHLTSNSIVSKLTCLLEQLSEANDSRHGLGTADKNKKIAHCTARRTVVIDDPTRHPLSMRYRLALPVSAVNDLFGLARRAALFIDGDRRNAHGTGQLQQQPFVFHHRTFQPYDRPVRN